MTSMSRRHFLAAAIGSLGCTGAVAQEQADPAAVDAWMKTWMSESRQAAGALHLSRFADPTYFLLKSIGGDRACRLRHRLRQHPETLLVCAAA
jgi:hypothetical protein